MPHTENGSEDASSRSPYMVIAPLYLPDPDAVEVQHHLPL